MTNLKVSRFWDEHRWKTVPIDYWASNPRVQAYINRRTTGNPNMRWLDWLAKTHVQTPVPLGLCLACGAGTAEIHAIASNMCRQMDACDISESSLEAARQKAKVHDLESRIHYFRCDLNRETLQPLRYNVVLSSGGLHHVEELEHLLDQIYRSLKPNGILAVDEYIGPPRLQYTDQQLETATRVVQALPALLQTGKQALRPTLEYMLENDPSEAVRSAEILPLLERKFEVLDKRFYGGTILNVLYGSGAIDPRFLVSDDKEDAGSEASHADLLPLILLLEEMLTELRTLPNDYAVIVVRKR